MPKSENKIEYFSFNFVFNEQTIVIIKIGVEINMLQFLKHNNIIPKRINFNHESKFK